MLSTLTVPGVRLLNFVVVGESRSGCGVVQSTLNNRVGAVCHAGLFQPDIILRRAAHEAYFGLGRDPKRSPEWFIDDCTSPCQYLNHVVFDNPLHGEVAVGLTVPYEAVQRWELHDLFHLRCQEGDFCLVHVLRNPVACFVSGKQAEHGAPRTRPWPETGAPPRIPGPMSLDAAELTHFCRASAAMHQRLNDSCSDRLEVQYQDLYTNYQKVMRAVFEFLELPECEDQAVPDSYRLRNRCMQERIYNMSSLRTQVPSDVRVLLDAEDLF